MRPEVKTIIILSAALFAAISISCGGARNNKAGSDSEAVAGSAEVVQYGYTILNTYPHSTDSYTQGLYWHDGFLWEGTGQRGQSAIKQIELETGRVVKQVDLDRRYFGEGIALLNGRIYQLTWSEETAFVYDSQTLERTAEFRYKGEGWGLTTDGEVLYMSDGTDRIYVVDPSDFKRKKVLNVRMDGKRLYYLNELEWIEGKIWANIYMTDALAIIDPATGMVEGIVDMSGLLDREDIRPNTDVLNGIAYDTDQKRIFVTGKNWNKLFHIELKEK